MAFSNLVNQAANLTSSINPEGLTKSIVGETATNQIDMTLSSLINQAGKLTSFMIAGDLTKSIVGDKVTAEVSALMASCAKPIMSRTTPYQRKIAAIISVTTPSTYFLAGAFGFNPAGIGGGTLAAAWQSYMYGGATPAGSTFAILQSMGMLKTLGAVKAGAAVVTSAIASTVAWICHDAGK